LSDRLADLCFRKFHLTDLELGERLQRIDRLTGRFRDLIPSIAQGFPVLIPVDNPFEASGPDVHEQTVNGNFGTDERTVADDVAALDDVLPFAGEQPEELVEVFRQQFAIDAERFQLVEQLDRARLAHLAIRVPDHCDFLSALDRAGQGQRAQGAAQRAGDDVTRVPQPDELVARQAEHVREQGVQPRVHACQRDHRQFILKIRDVDTGGGITRDRPVIGIDNGFKQAHEL
jgi:hypothetical protein